MFHAIQELGPDHGVMLTDWDNLLSQLDKPTEQTTVKMFAGGSFGEENKDNPEIMKAIKDGRIVIL